MRTASKYIVHCTPDMEFGTNFTRIRFWVMNFTLKHIINDVFVVVDIIDHSYVLYFLREEKIFRFNFAKVLCFELY